MKKIFEIFKKINWKKTGITFLIIYIIAWSYFYLALKYGEHRTMTVERILDTCTKSEIEGSSESFKACADAFKRNSVNIFIFKPIIGW